MEIILKGKRMKQLNIYELKAHFSEYIDEVHDGKTIIIAKAGKPWAKLVPLKESPKKKFQFGTMKGKIKMAKDFDAPLPQEILDLFEGKAEKK